MFENLIEKSIFNVKKEIISLLKNSKNPFVAQSPVLDANILLCHFLNLSKTALICNDSRILTATELDTIQQGIEKRLSGLPVAYITNHKEFFGYDFYVDQNVLIPKPDTELLVEQALLAVDKAFATAPEKKTDYKIADICTGSGCIAISVLKTLFQKYRASIKVAASDISKAALVVAEKNADTLLSQEERQNISFYQGDLFQAFSSSENQKFDMILSNPPYVPTNLTDELLSDGRSEPRLALDGESDGLGIIRRLVVEAKNHLKEGGVFFLEAGEYNVEEAGKCLLNAGFTDIFIHKDLAGLLRLVEAHIN
ncbi:MAG: peptide chain release factor N(5)-glutamine methyltransferase [Spirochaetaceae bacterium]|nr:peptide chain release factor N(5)-glutamine methyltransferase [Spirochaetaceae bacterium]